MSWVFRQSTGQFRQSGGEILYAGPNPADPLDWSGMKSYRDNKSPIPQGQWIMTQTFLPRFQFPVIELQQPGQGRYSIISTDDSNNPSVLPGLFICVRKETLKKIIDSGDPILAILP